MTTVTHPVDPACPYCARHPEVLAAEAARDARNAPQRGKIEGSDRPLVQWDDRGPRIPAWVDPKIQPASIQKRIADQGA